MTHLLSRECPHRESSNLQRGTSVIHGYPLLTVVTAPHVPWEWITRGSHSYFSLCLSLSYCSRCCLRLSLLPHLSAFRPPHLLWGVCAICVRSAWFWHLPVQCLWSPLATLARSTFAVRPVMKKKGVCNKLHPFLPFLNG